MAAHPISDVNRLLENAIKEKQLEQVRQALEEGADANSNSTVTVVEGSCTMLGLAAYYGRVDIMELLIDAGADIEARNMRGETPLFHSIAGGHTEAVKFLLERDADIYATDNDRRTALFEATERNNHEILNVLLAAGADVNVKDNNGRTPRTLCGDVLAKNLLDIYYKLGLIQEKSRIPLQELIEHSNVLIQQNVYPLSSGTDRQIDPLNEFQMLLDEALERMEPQGLLLQSIRKNDLDGVYQALEEGANIHAADKEGRTPLFEAVRKGQTETAQLLIDTGANIEAADNWGRTPLFEAVRKGQTETAQLLIDTGANIEAADNWWGRTPLFEAVRKGQTETVQLLIGRGANIYATDKKGRTPLFEASTVEIASFLIKSGASPNATDNRGRIPLTIAKSIEMRQFLLPYSKPNRSFWGIGLSTLAQLTFFRNGGFSPPRIQHMREGEIDEPSCRCNIL